MLALTQANYVSQGENNQPGNIILCSSDDGQFPDKQLLWRGGRSDQTLALIIFEK